MPLGHDHAGRLPGWDQHIGNASAGDAGVFWAAHKRYLESLGGDVLCYILA
jgi:hypothetical protein